MKVADAMTRSVVAVPPATPLRDVAGIMVQRGISGVPVIDPTGLVLGVVSEADFVIKERGAAAIRHRFLARLFGDSRTARAELRKIEAQTAGEAMTSPAVTIGAAMPLRDAAQLMAERRINRLPVVEEGRLVGIVTRADLVRAFCRPDDELEGLVRERVLARTAFWLEPDTFGVEVRDGVVSLSGRVERRSLAEAILEVTRELGGVIAVRSALTWVLDDVKGRPETQEPDLLLTIRPH
jgi:CBS domain-containing protein